MLKFILIPTVGALTGWLTNYIAVRMLFRPRLEKRFAGIAIQGLIPRRRPQIAESVGQTVSEHLVSHDDIKRALDDPEIKERAGDLLERHIDRLIDEKLGQLNPMVGAFLKGDLRERLKNMLREEFIQVFPELADGFMDVVERKIDFKQIVVEKIEAFDLERLEKIILRIASRELRAIEIWGGILGFVIGLLTVAILALE